jgi:hypothetical protein
MFREIVFYDFTEIVCFQIHGGSSKR